jgi:hypothetical protein
MITKLFLGSVVGLGLLLSSVLGAGEKAKDCCSAKAACCNPASACCTTDAKAGCCQTDMKCCAEKQACCSAPPQHTGPMGMVHCQTAATCGHSEKSTACGTNRPSAANQPTEEVSSSVSW